MPISPLHVLLYQTFFFSKNVQIRFFSKFVDFCRCTSFRSSFFMLQRSYTFLFFILWGIGELPNKRDWVHCIHTMYTNPLLAPFRNINIDKIYFSGTGTKIKEINIENIILYKKAAYPALVNLPVPNRLHPESVLSCVTFPVCLF